MACPYCGKANKSKEFICVDGFEQEWAELCNDCHRYIVGVDLRRRTAVTTDVAAIGMVQLDIIAQQKGFSPMAACAWNGVIPGS